MDSIIDITDLNGTINENSTLNKNVTASELDISASDESDNLIIVESPPNLSISMNPHEMRLLKGGQSKAGKNTTIDLPTMNDVEMLGTAIDHLHGTTATEPSLTEDTLAADEMVVITEDCYFQDRLVEVARRLWPSTSIAQNYIKGCSWSPDGTCLLVPVHLDGMHVIELPTDLYTCDAAPALADQEMRLRDLNTAVHVPEGGTVYDSVWYPFMNSSQPETCFWLATRQHEPIHMWDAFNGGLRCSYRGYDDVDEVEAAISLAFSNDGQRVFGGFKKSIKVFHTRVPGRDCVTMKVKQAVSCFALTPNCNDTLTTGSWNGYINHYDIRAPQMGALFTLGGHKGGITWLRYMSDVSQNLFLFSGARRDNTILLWDMRNYTAPVREFHRTVATNQRIHFDLSPQQQRWLVSGDTRGVLNVWDLLDDGDAVTKTGLQLHADCLNGVSFHPTLPILATTSGQYHFANVAENSDNTYSPLSSPATPDDTVEQQFVDYENALLLLWLDEQHLPLSTQAE